MRRSRLWLNLSFLSLAFSFLLAHDFFPHSHDHHHGHSQEAPEHHHPLSFDQETDLYLTAPGNLGKALQGVTNSFILPEFSLITSNEGFSPTPAGRPPTSLFGSSLSFRGPPAA